MAGMILMVAVISLIAVLTVSVLITRVATIALAHTGLSRESARFQARSAFTGVGFTTGEAEHVVSHPVRRRILMLLMLLGNAGIVTVVSSAILTFVDTKQSEAWMLRLVVLIVALSALWTAAQSQWLDRHISRVVSAALNRWSTLDVRDYASLLHLGGEYRIIELLVEEGDWIAHRTLADLRLREEGVMVLGIETPGGKYLGAPDGETLLKPGYSLLAYGRTEALQELDNRRVGFTGDIHHEKAVARQDQAKKEQHVQLERESTDA